MRALTPAIGAVGLLLTLASPAAGGIGDATASVTADGDTITTQIGLAGGGFFSIGTNPLVDCTFGWSKTGAETVEMAETVTSVGQLTGVVPGGVGPSSELFNVALCPNQNLYLIWLATDGAPASIGNPLALAAAARLQIPFPTGESSPPGTADWPHITQLQVWYWIQPQTWQPVTSRASLEEVEGPADIWVEVTATPVESIWTPGDKSDPISCERGLEWTKGLDDRDSPCHHTYTQKPEPGETFTLTVGIRWQITIRCSHPALCAGITPIDDHIGQNQQQAWITSVVPVLTR